MLGEAVALLLLQWLPIKPACFYFESYLVYNKNEEKASYRPPPPQAYVSLRASARRSSRIASLVAVGRIQTMAQNVWSTGA